MSVVAVAGFFLFGTFSFFVEGVDNPLRTRHWRRLLLGLYPFPGGQGDEFRGYGVSGRPRHGLFRLGVGEPALGGMDRFEKSWSLCRMGCRESTAIVDSRPSRAMGLAA